MSPVAQRRAQGRRGGRVGKGRFDRDRSTRRRNRIGSKGNWSFLDRVGLTIAWGMGLFLCAVAFSITAYLAVQGLQFINWEVISTSPVAGVDQEDTGGFLDPILGTVILTILGAAIAAPIGVAIAIWLTEYGRPAGLARLVEAGIEVIVGAPSIVLAIFGLLVFQTSLMSPFSFTAAGGEVFGRSFIAAGAVMSLIALPFVVGGTREALNSIPNHVREASYALGKDKASTIRRVLLPSARSGIATGSTLGMAQIAGDTAVVVVLLGASLQLAPEGTLPVLDVLRGTGSTLTSYVFQKSPAGEGNAPDKAYAAAFVLLMLVVVLNLSVNFLTRRGEHKWT